MLCLTALTLCASAGTYNWTHTDPVTQVTTHSPTFSGGYYDEYGDGTSVPDYDGGNGDYFTYDPQGIPGSVYSAGGTFTVTFTWRPDDGKDMTSDPPPQYAIVNEYGEADLDTPGLGTCDDGLGDAPEEVTGGGWVSDSIPNHNRAHAGGASFFYSRTASVSADAIGGNYMFYSASAYAVTIGGPPVNGQSQPNMRGVTIVNGTQEALTGQTIGAALNVPGGTAGNFHWSTTGGSPFETWQPATPVVGQAPAKPYASYYPPLDPADADATGSPFTFNDATDGDTVYVTCTATATFNDDPPGTVTAKSLPVMFLKPTAVWIVNGPDNINTPGFGHDTADIGANRIGAEIDWNPVTIALPKALKSVGGTGGFGQTIKTLDGNMTRSGAPSTYYNKVQINGNLDASGNPVYLTPFPNLLDVSFPIYGNNETWSVNGGFGNTGDSPAQPYTGNVSIDAGGNYWNKSIVTSNSYQTWLMYQPPGGVWVPLQMISWGWNGTATLDVSTSVWTFKGDQDMPTSTSDSNGVGMVTSTPPSWNNVKTAGAMRP